MADMSSPRSIGTIVAVTYDNGVVLGADSRTITGTYVANRASDKITQLTDNVYLCRSGSAANSQAVSDQVRCHLHRHTISLGRPATVKEVANIVRHISYNHKSMLRADMIVAGWDERGGGQVYGVPLGGTVNFIRKYKDEIYKVEIEMHFIRTKIVDKPYIYLT